MVIIAQSSPVKTPQRLRLVGYHELLRSSVSVRIVQPEEHKKSSGDAAQAAEEHADWKGLWRPSNVDEAGSLLVRQLQLQNHSCSFESGKEISHIKGAVSASPAPSYCIQTCIHLQSAWMRKVENLLHDTACSASDGSVLYAGAMLEVVCNAFQSGSACVALMEEPHKVSA